MDSDARPLPLVHSGPTASADVIFPHIAIIGLGLIGGSIAAAARRAWPSSLVIGVDRNEVLEQAVALHAVDVASSSLTIVSEADLIVLAAPVLANISILAQLCDYVEKPTTVTDVGSTKRAIADAARALPPNLSFVGGHPLAGAARGGIAMARPDLFAGRPWFFSPPPSPPGSSGNGQSHAGGGESDVGREPDRETPLARLMRFASALGAVPRTIDPAAHDRLLAFLSHLPQLAATALMETVGETLGEGGLELSGRGLQDATRLAASPADIWTDICGTNADEIGPALDRLIGALGDLRANLSDADTIARHFDSANRWRSLL